MKNMMIFLVAGMIGSHAQAYTSDYQVDFGPFFGGGVVSNSGTLRHASGYSLGFERQWQLSSRTSIGPRLEVGNSFINIRTSDADSQETWSYDHRIIAAGLSFSSAVGTDKTFAQGAYLTALAGKTYSKLTLDTDIDLDAVGRSRTQSQFSGIRGDFFSGELGGWIPLKGQIGINLALMGAVYHTDHSAAKGSFETERLVDGSLQLTSGTLDEGDNGLEERLVTKTLVGKIGVAIGF